MTETLPPATSPRRAASWRLAVDCISRIARERSGRPAIASPTPAIWPSYAISPTSRKPGRRTTVRASAASWPGARSGERRAPTRTRPPTSR